MKHLKRVVLGWVALTMLFAVWKLIAFVVEHVPPEYFLLAFFVIPVSYFVGFLIEKEAD